ncbi:hypothetical protein [Mycolicibacterium sp. CBMA 234]|uniref:hypothetical protein n=1 Tax=Mycolicibacterium sp. CBMA 234 TaxID=1918495 RepID=UPI0012DF1BDF|nr:hypothetical protein [Mycolicibacterium sp. CBMA 234]
MGAHEARYQPPEDAAQDLDDERRARINAISRHIAENSKELFERLARWGEH